MSQSGHFLAKALYDNIAETPDELAFRRGDVLTVLEQDTKGLDGWWLCSLRGKHGIAPGNRLKILSGMSEGGNILDVNKIVIDRGQQDYDVPPTHSGHSDISGRRSSNATTRNSGGSRKGSLGDDLYDTPPSSKRGSAETTSGIYDTPPSSKRSSSERTPPHSNRSSASRDSGSHIVSPASQQALNGSLSLPLIVKRRHSNTSDNFYETPPGSNRSSLERILSDEGPPIYESLSASNSTENLSEEPMYDTPPSRKVSSLRSVASSDSLLSNTSGVSSARLSQAASLPDSARSSMDVPVDIYDVPLSHGNKQCAIPTPSASSGNLVHSSDVLKTSHSLLDCKANNPHREIKRSRSLEHTLDDSYDTPKSNAPLISQKKSGQNSSGHSSSGAIMESSVYDIPPQVMRDSVISMRSDSSDENQRFSLSSLDTDQHISEIWDELLLDLDSALEMLTKRQQDVSKATSKLTGYVNSSWRSRLSLEKTLYDIKVSCSLVKNSLSEFVHFAQGARANALRGPDKSLASKLQKYLSPLMSTLELVQKSFANLEEMKWQVNLLCEPLDKPDDLGQIALVAKELLPEVKKVASFIQNHSSVLFKKAVISVKKPPTVPRVQSLNEQKFKDRPLPAVPGVTSNTGLSVIPKKMSSYDFKAELHKDDYAECDDVPGIEYDYVRLDSKECLKKTELDSKDLLKKTEFVAQNGFRNEPISVSVSAHDLSKLTNDMRQCKVGFDEVDTIPVKDSAWPEEGIEDAELKTPVNKVCAEDLILHPLAPDTSVSPSEPLDPNDRQVLVYYTEQINSHATLLGNAVDAFLNVVRNNQPPNVFISHSKFVIVSAHKLVHIGDSLHRNLISNSVSGRIMNCANHLCDCLKASVTATKTAALKYPCPPAVQEMVDRVIEVSHAAHELKVVITQAAK